jgi:hypothetical protein
MYGNRRTRLWRSLRYHDLFFCAMMGRTPSTMTTDSYYSEKHSTEALLPAVDSGQQHALLESARAFSIMERTVTEQHSKSTASLARVEALARELQSAASSIPSELRTLTDPSRPEQQQVLRNAFVACNYYFSMMLLTRPFLISSVQVRCRRAATSTPPSDQRDEFQKERNNVNGAMASIDSAVHAIQLIHELLLSDMLFNNMPLVV